MSVKFYQFDYAEMDNHEIVNLGILCIETEKLVTKDVLKDYAKKSLHKPDAHIIISSVTRLSKNEFEKIKLRQQGLSK